MRKLKRLHLVVVSVVSRHTLIMLTTLYSSNTGMQARQMLERKPPTWTSTLSSTRSFSVLRRPTSGFDSSSAMTISTGRPLMPPDLLMRSTAICRPTSAVLPPAAPAPDSGCKVPTLYGLAWPKAARHGAGTSMVAPSAPAAAPYPITRRRVVFPLYQDSSTQSSILSLSVMASPLWMVLCGLLLLDLKETRSNRHIQLVFVRPPDDKMGGKPDGSPETRDGTPHVRAHRRPPSNARPAERPRRPHDDPPERASRADLRAGARLRAGQSRDPAGRARRRLPALLPAQPETVPAAGRFGARRLAAADARRRPRYPHRSAALSRVARGPHRRRARGYQALVARRSRLFRDRLLVLVRGGAARERHRAAPHDLRLHGADVSHHDRDRAGGSVPWARGGVDAADEAGRRDPRHPGDDAVAERARRAGAYRQAGADRHQGPGEARLRRRGAGARRRAPGVLGVRRHAAVGGGDGQAGLLHHALSRLHAGDRSQERRAGDHVTRAGRRIMLMRSSSGSGHFGHERRDSRNGIYGISYLG